MRHSARQAIAAAFLILSTIAFMSPSFASVSAWEFDLGPLASPGAGSRLCARTSASDGYDSYDSWFGTKGNPGWVHAAPYHQNGEGWSGRTGLYTWDYHATLVGDRTSTTWSNVYLWAQDYWNGADVIQLYTRPYDGAMPPPWYRARLYLDYVPASANWGDRPTVFDISPTGDTYFELPIVAVSNPLDGVRMHFTVTTPEPSSLLALGGGLAALGLLRRRNKK